MPFKSDAQRRWGHTEKGEKALGGPKAVNEWDQATKGRDLPEHVKQMADGGEVGDLSNLMEEQQPSAKDQYLTNLGQGIKGGVNHDMDAVKEFLTKLYDSKGVPEAGSTLGTDTTGFQGLANKAAQGYAEGGVVDDGQDFLAKLNNGTALTPPPQQPQFNPQAGLPPAPPPPVTPAPMPGNDVSSYLAGQKAQLNRYGPEQQMAVSNDILGRQNSLGGRLANAGAGLGDALMAVGGKQSPGFQQNLQNRQNQQGALQMEALKGAREANVQNVEQGQKLDQMDPNSKISKATQASQGLVLSALGFDPRTIGRMSAAEIPAAINTLKDLGLKEREIMVAKYKAQIEANALAETSKHNRAEEAHKGQELAETAKQHGVEAGLKGEEIGAGMLEKAAAVPLTSRVATALGANPAATELEKEALSGNAGPVSHVTSQAEYDALAPGAHFVDSTGQRKVKGKR